MKKFWSERVAYEVSRICYVICNAYAKIWGCQEDLTYEELWELAKWVYERYRIEMESKNHGALTSEEVEKSYVYVRNWLRAHPRREALQRRNEPIRIEKRKSEKTVILGWQCPVCNHKYFPLTYKEKREILANGGKREAISDETDGMLFEYAAECCDRVEELPETDEK